LPDGLKVKVVVEEAESNQPTLLNLLNHVGALPDMPGDFVEQLKRKVASEPPGLSRRSGRRG
jgi:hypothetical protein